LSPTLLTNEIIEFVANSDKFMPHFHIPLQSGSNKILGSMRRRYKRELYAERVALIKTLMPHCCIGVDVIVGFPEKQMRTLKTVLISAFIGYLLSPCIHLF
jgi:threonylcarbamoyladenosine tRNA methylthiotransferase MtaB